MMLADIRILKSPDPAAPKASQRPFYSLPADRIGHLPARISVNSDPLLRVDVSLEWFRMPVIRSESLT